MISFNSAASFAVFTQIVNDLGNFLFEYEIQIDSRKVNSNSIFCAYPGVSNDGRDYIDKAVKAGAKAILYESGAEFDIPIKNIAVKNLMLYVGLLAAYKYQNPSKKFYTIGVTGTNGKTSITHWLNQLYTKLGSKTAIIGTTGAGLYNQISDYSSTTPDPITVQKLLNSFAQEKIDLLAMEVSSHSLHQGRVNGVDFKSAIFTNLSQDHLDYHKTMDAYYRAKADLFYWHNLEHAIINADDKYGMRLLNELKADIKQHKKSVKIVTYGLENGDVRAQNLSITLSGMSFILVYNNEEFPLHVKVIGRFNVYNILAVAASMIARGYAFREIAPLFANLKSVCGRMDVIIKPGRPLVVVDYAHTPDALFNTLSTLKEVEHSGRLYCVVGCGGNRDATKRPIMGNVATKIADYTFITSDNPRNEDPKKIIEQITLGCVNTNYTVIVDRKEAIVQAITQAHANDIILIAGKGHETYQEINGVKHHFSDFEVAEDGFDKLEDMI